MDLDPRNFLNLLYKYLEDENLGPKQCNQLFTNLNEVLTRDQVNLPDLDLYLQCLFNKSQGLLEFVTKIVNKKQFKSSIVSVFEIIYALINNFSSKLEKYVTVVYDICFKVVKSSLVTSDEKVKALEVITLSFEKLDRCIDFPECYTEVYSNLIRTISIKKCDTVQDKIFKALGAFAKHFQYMISDPDSLKHIFLNALETQMVQKDFSNGVVSGAFTGLNCFCESFPFDPNSSDDTAVLKRLYKYIDRLTIETSSRIKVANRAALTFLGNNITLFASLMTEKIQYWHENLLKWLWLGADDQKVGVFVIKAFYRGLGNFLSNDATQQHKHVTLYFAECFKQKLSDSSVSNRERRLCLHGFSSFSAVFQSQLNEEEMKDILILILQNFEQAVNAGTDPSPEALEDLPFYLQTVAKFVHFRKITNNELFCLQKGTIMLMKAYPQLPYSCHGAAVESLVSSFYYLSSNDEKLFDNFVENVIYQGVVWSCSHQHISEEDTAEKGNQSVLTVKSYFSMWKKLLGIQPLREFDKMGIFLHDRKYLLIKIIDKLMRTLLVLINKLNVSITLNNTAEPVTDIQSAYKVVAVDDFAIFLNAVDFYEEIFNQVDPTILKKCACKLIHHLVSKCDKYPLISGFYKLLSFSLKVCNKINYFDESSSNITQDVKMCNLTLTLFADGLLHKTQQFKGDLLIGCLQVLLEYPIVIIQKLLPMCVPAFMMIFYVGRNYIKLAHMALDTLEHWQKEMPSEDMEPFLIQVVPLLDYYLQSKSLGTLTESNVAESRRKTAQALKKRKVVLNIEPELIRLQMRIIKFIGAQGNSLCEAFALREDNMTLSVWSNQQHLKVVLPYEDIKLDIYLDTLLPRITNIALNSPDRKTRVMTCELLQAIMMVFLGTTKQMPHSGLSDLNEMLRHVSVPLLKLGCDMDQVVEQLFRPLCFQLIHWYTHVSQSRSEHSAIIIEAVLESITHPTDTALRDFSGKCINEFVKWTIKQTSEKNLARDPINIKILLKKMRFYSMHPDPYKKLGAALIFNNIYRELREESALLSIFWIEFVHIYIKSLSTYEYEATEENSIVHINSALSHIERGFVEKSDLFNTEDRDRRIPTDMKGGTLKDVALWLLEQTGSSSRYCRAKCMELFCNIVPKTPQYSSLEKFVSKYFKKENWIQETYESFLTHYPTLEDLSRCENVSPNKWLQAFLCALDGYQFVVSHKLVSKDDILSETIIKSIRYFLSNVSTSKIDHAFSLIQAKEWLFTSFEQHTFDKQRSQVALKILELLNAITPNCKSVYNSDLWQFSINIIFNRDTLGFECFLPNNNIDGQIATLMKEFLKKLPEDKALELMNMFEMYITENLATDVNFKTHVPLKQRNILKGLSLLQSFTLNNFAFTKFSGGIIANLLNNFILDAENGVIYTDSLQDTTLNYCLSVLDFALSNENEFRTLIEFLYKPLRVQTTDYKQPIPFGTYLLTLFEDSVIGKILTNFDVFLKLSLEQYKVTSQTTELIFYILSYAVPKRQLKYVNETVVHQVILKWEIFEKYFNDSGNIESGLDFIKCLAPVIKSSKLECGSLKRWLIGALSGEHQSWKFELDIKVEVFYLLVDVMDALDDENTDLSQKLNVVKERLFSESSPIPSESKIIFLDKLLCTIPKIRTPELLIFILELYMRMTTEKSNADLKKLLKDYIINNQQTQKIALSKVYKLYYNDCFDNNQKYKLISNTQPLFQFCTDSVFEDFFVANIAEMISTLKDPTTSLNLFKKITHFLLLEILFSRCPIKSADMEASKITQAALPQKPSNKALLLQLLKITLEAVKDSIDSDPDDFFRLYKCHSYNAMVSIVSNSMKEINFYTKLFVRQENNIDILWSSIIDTKKTYVFQAYFDTIPSRRKILVNIRDEVRARKKMQGGQSESVRYMESMRVYNSSLSEDFSKFDFSNNIVRSQLEDEDTQNKIEIELDGTDINCHECMASVCGLIEYMVNNNITELPTEEDEDYELPAWVSGIRALLLNPETHGNVKIFWVKVIDNSVHIFKNFAKFFLEPLLKFVLDRCAGTDINYFITDVVAILAAWSTEAVPKTDSEIKLASDLITFVINNLKNDRQDMFKYHVDLVRVLIEAWKSAITVPYDLLYSKLNVDPTSKKVEIGVHLFSIFLANKIFPWEDQVTAFCKTTFNIIMNSTHKSTYKPCAETVGLLLRSTSNKPAFSKKVFGNVHVLLKKIREPEKYAHVLESVALHYPQIADEFHIKLLLSRVYGVPMPLKVIYLRIILTRSSIMNKIDEFKTENWDSYIENDNLEVQLVSLEIVHKCLETLKHSSLFRSIVVSVCSHVSNSNVLCRTRMFDIVTSICQKGGYSSDIMDLCKPVLVQGLTDSDVEIREKVYDFWRNNRNLPAQISSRFAYVLTNLYETATENDFLGYSSHILLDVIRKTQEYDEMLFEHPLEDCDFESYQLQANWRARHLSVVPLFAETVRSVTPEFETFDADASKLRQTQTGREFAPTQSVRARQFSQYTMSESSLLVKSEDDKEFINPNLVPLSHKYRVPKRRFLRDKSKIRSYFAEQEVKKLVDKSERRKDLVKERENKVNIYRSYRKGDLPDVQIPLQAVLDPLQALTLHDGEISKILYSQLFQSILQKMKNDFEFIEQISSAIKVIFTNSNQFNRNLFRTLLDTLLQCKSSFTFPPELIVSVCQSSGLRAIGVLLLEEYLICYDPPSFEAKRTRGPQSTGEVDLWIKLAELYKEMDEWDVVKSIFLEKTECPEIIKNGLIAESRKQWKDAQDVYKKLITTDENLERKDFYYESCFKCFAHLGEWDKLVESIDSTVTHSGNNCWDNLWDGGFYQNKLMPWYINGQLKNALFTETSSNQFLSDLNTTLNSERLDYLENRFSEEIAMLWIFKGETDEAERYLKMYMNKFLNNWQQLDLFYGNLRYNNLLKLRNIVDINKFLGVFNSINAEDKSQIEELANHWNRTAHENLPSILYCEEKVLYRRQLVNLLIKKIESLNSEELEDVTDELSRVKFNLDEGLMDIGIEQNNFYMTKKYLSNYNKKNILKLKLVLSKMAYIKSAMLTESAKKIEVLLRGCETLNEIFETRGQSPLKVVSYVHLFKQLDEISSLLRDNNELFQQRKPQFEKLLGSGNVSSAEDIALCGADKLKSFLRAYENELDDKMNTESKCTRGYETIADAYVRLAYFAKKKGKECFSDFMLFVLRAMKFNSSEGRQLFPCIIMEKEFSEENTRHFVEETDAIPVWMFLGWIPQILVNVDSPKISAVAPLIIKIAKTYPQAIMYAYRLSKENYTAQSEESKQLIESLDGILLSDESIDKFLQALSCVGIPAAILLYHIRKMMKFSQTNDVTQLKTTLEIVQNEFFHCKPDSRDVTLLQGNMFKKTSKFDKDFKNFERLLNKKSSSADLMKQLKKLDDEVMKILRDPNENKKNSQLLKDYCPWLANFSAHKLNMDLEIPGQYDGNRMPLTQHHVKIAGFCPNVSVMASLRKPIKITVLGNDTREYPFLIKFGEDVRQDQRIQQLFSLMNNIFENDKSLSGQKLSILTYQVIPLTTSLGIIQWIGNTSSLQEFVKKCLKDVKSIKSYEQVFDTYHNFVYNRSENQIAGDAYGRAAMKYSRDKVITKFRAMESSVERNVLKSHFLKISTNTESFFALRNNFITSYAVMSISHWLLGVGDRHLSNSLICLQNGKVLGIDFGHAFGTATQILPVPELVPFRLTPHLVSLMEPLGEKGIFKEIMVHCLRSLRSNSGSLLSTMNVFIEEPSLDWLEHASKCTGSTDVSDCMWYPAQKVDQAERKLLGAKSTTIMVEDLEAGHQKNKNYMNAYIKLVEGVPGVDRRAVIQGAHLSVEDQVDCLIDHATDYNLLGRMFEGWASWV